MQQPVIRPAYDRSDAFIGFKLLEWNEHSQRMQAVGAVQPYAIELAAQWVVAMNRYQQMVAELESQA